MSAIGERTTREAPLVVFAVVALAIAALWWFGSRAQSPAAALEPASPSAAVERPLVPTPDPAAPAPSQRSEPAVEAAAEPPAPAPPAPPDDPRLAWLAGTVVDPGGAPLRGARVVALRAHSSANTLLWLDPGFRARLERAGETVTGADGRFHFVLPRGVPFDLEASADGGEAFAALRHAGEDVRLTLGAAREVHGALTRARDGGPIAGARVRVIEARSCAVRETRSGADGSYRLRYPFLETAYLEVLPEMEEATQWLALEPGPDGTSVMDLALADGAAVVGRVTDADEKPLAGALVGEGWQFRRTAMTDADGNYRLPGIGGGGAHGLAARAAGHGTVKRLELPPVVDGAIHVDFALPLAWSARGRVVDREGAPVAGALVETSGWGPPGLGQQMERSWCRTEADGRFHVENLSPGWRQTGSVGAPGFATLVFRLSEPRRKPAAELGDLVLGPPALIGGRVLDAGGAAAAGADVMVEGEKGWRSAVTDALGRFAFGDLGAGNYVLHASRYGRPAHPRFHVLLGEQEIRAEHELRLQRGAALRGRVIDEAGAGIGGVQIQANQEDAKQARGEIDDALYTSTVADGWFALEDVPAGVYGLQAFARPAAEPERPWLAGGMQSVETDSPPVEIVLRRGELIRGRVVDSSGAPLLNHSVVAHGPEGRAGPASTDAQGRFELPVASRTTWELRVSGPLQGATYEQVLLAEPGIPAGARDVVLRLPPR